jgi:hypothetical protein
MYEVSYERAGPHCERRLRNTLATHHRALIYVGFPDMPDGFFEELVARLTLYGTVVEQATFSDRSHAAVMALDPEAMPDVPADPECLVLAFARRW